MRVLRTVAEMRAACRDAEGLGLVPTMGALHAGHVSLLRAARGRSGVVAASIFVNPLQFAAGEDLDKYPRTFDEDCAVLERALSVPRITCPARTRPATARKARGDVIRLG